MDTTSGSQLTRVGNQPRTRPRMPSSRITVPKPVAMEGYLAELACMLHLTTSRGVTSMCVSPQLATPPAVQAM